MVIVALAEAFPPHRRAVLLSCAYAAAICIFGGSTQFVVTWLIERTGDAMMPAYYRTASVAIGLLAAHIMPETAPKRVRRLVARPAYNP